MNRVNHCEEPWIIDALQGGNEVEQNKAIKCIMTKCFPGSIARLKKMGLTKEKIKDVLQAVLIILWSKVKSGKYTQEGSLCAFFGQTAYYTAIKGLKQKELIGIEMPIEIEDPDEELSPIKELYNYCLHYCIAIRKAQNEKHYLILHYYYWENLPIRTIAARVGYTEGATRVILHTTRIALGICIIGCRDREE